MAGIKLSQLPPLDVIEQVPYDTIRADLAQRAELTNVSPSDPAYRSCSAAAYRERVFRQYANDQAKGLSLAEAVGPQLDHIGHTYYRTPDGKPVERLDGESDDDYRDRLAMAPQGLSVAGPYSAYIFHAMSAHSDIRHVELNSPAPVEVDVYVLAHSNNGVPGQDVLDAVDATTQPVRPLTDKVGVHAATIVDYFVDAELTLASFANRDAALEEARRQLDAYTESQFYLKGRVVLSGIHAALTVEGVDEVKLLNWPDGGYVCNYSQAPRCTGHNIRAV